MTDDERAIRTLVDTWMSATRAGDLETVLDLMVDDVIFMVPGKEPFGKEAFAEASKSMKGVRFDGRSDIRELVVVGDWAYLRNFIELTVTREGAPRPCNGQVTRSLFCAGMRMVDGCWPATRIYDHVDVRGR